MAWLLLIAASAVEVLMALALKYAQGWTRLGPSLAGIALALASIGLLTLALKHLPAGTAYAIWTGLGSLGVAAVGVLWLGESATPARLTCIALIVLGTAGLRFTET
jgi:quaternary ammonium compound-resistance protein SugE